MRSFNLLSLLLFPLAFAIPTPTDKYREVVTREYLTGRNWYEAPGWANLAHAGAHGQKQGSGSGMGLGFGNQLASEHQQTSGGHSAQRSRPSQPPHPSASGDNHSRRHRKKEVLPVLPLGSPNDLARCPASMLACPVSALDTSANPDWECVAPQEDLYSCGGCSTLGTGIDCTAIPSALSVSCMMGSCNVHSCTSGFVPSADGLSCIRPLVTQR